MGFCFQDLLKTAHIICCDTDKRKTWGTQKELIEKHKYSCNRNKIQVNLVKQWLVDRKLRVQWDSDYSSTMQMVSHVIVSHWLMHSLTCIYGGGWVHYVGSITVSLRHFHLAFYPYILGQPYNSTETAAIWKNFHFISSKRSNFYIVIMIIWYLCLFVCLFGFHGVLTFVGYLMPNPFLYK